MPFFNRPSDSTLVHTFSQDLVLNDVESIPNPLANLGKSLIVGRKNLYQNSGVFNTLHGGTGVDFSSQSLGLNSNIFGMENCEQFSFGRIISKVRQNATDQLLDINDVVTSFITQAQVDTNGWSVDKWNYLLDTTDGTTLGPWALTGAGVGLFGKDAAFGNPFKSFYLKETNVSGLFIPLYVSIFNIDVLNEYLKTMVVEDSLDVIRDLFSTNRVNTNAGFIYNEGKNAGRYVQQAGFSLIQSLEEARAVHALPTVSFPTGVTPSFLNESFFENELPGVQNQVFGFWALRTNLTGKQNTIMGWGAGQHNIAGSHNVSIGHRALSANQSGSENVTLGWGAAENAVVYNDNVTIGWDALKGVAIANGTVAVGWEAGKNLTKNNENVFIGFKAGKRELLNGQSFNTVPITNVSSTAHTQVVSVGWLSGANTNSSKSVLIGWSAGGGTPPSLEPGSGPRGLISGSNLIGWGVGRALAQADGYLVDNCNLIGWELGTDGTSNQISFKDSQGLGYGAYFSTGVATNSTALGMRSCYRSQVALNVTAVGKDSHGAGAFVNTANSISIGNSSNSSAGPVGTPTINVGSVSIVEPYLSDTKYNVDDLVYTDVIKTKDSQVLTNIFRVTTQIGTNNATPSSVSSLNASLNTTNSFTFVGSIIRPATTGVIVLVENTNSNTVGSLVDVDGIPILENTYNFASFDTAGTVRFGLLTSNNGGWTRLHSHVSTKLNFTVDTHVIQNVANTTFNVPKSSKYVSSILLSLNTIDSTTPITAGAFIVGSSYKILTVGSTNFTSIGASANTIGVVFTATGVGSGTGTASLNSAAVKSLNKFVYMLPYSLASYPVYADTNRTNKISWSFIRNPALSSETGVVDANTTLVVGVDNICLGVGTSLSTNLITPNSLTYSENQTVIGSYVKGAGSNTTVLNNFACETTIVNGTSTSKLEIAGNTLNINTSSTPTSGAAGKAGDIRWDADSLYVCTATNTWKKVALTSV